MWVWTAISSVVAVIQLVIWIQAERSTAGTLRRRIGRAGILTVLSALIAFSAYQASANSSLKDSREHAKHVVDSWQLRQASSLDGHGLDALDNGELQGILLAGLGFLSQHRSEFQDPYRQAKRLYEPLVSPSWDETKIDKDRRHSTLTEAATAMVTLFESEVVQ